MIAAARNAPTESERAAALDAVVAGHLRLALTLAHRYRGRGAETEDLEQVAALALMKAIQRYDLTATTPFGAYATPTITGELRRHFRDHGWLVRPPRPLQEQRQQLARAREELAQQLGRQPDEDDLAAAMGVSITDLRRVEVAEQNLRPASLDAPAGHTDLTLLEMIQSVGSGTAATGAVGRRLGDHDDTDQDLRLMVTGAIAALPMEQRQVIHLRFVQELAQKDIAQLLDLAPMTVSRLQKRALRTLATHLQHLAPSTSASAPTTPSAPKRAGHRMRAATEEPAIAMTIPAA